MQGTRSRDLEVSVTGSFGKSARFIEVTKEEAIVGKNGAEYLIFIACCFLCHTVAI